MLHKDFQYCPLFTLCNSISDRTGAAHRKSGRQRHLPFSNKKIFLDLKSRASATIRQLVDDIIKHGGVRDFHKTETTQVFDEWILTVLSTACMCSTCSELHVLFTSVRFIHESWYPKKHFLKESIFLCWNFSDKILVCVGALQVTTVVLYV